MYLTKRFIKIFFYIFLSYFGKKFHQSYSASQSAFGEIPINLLFIKILEQFLVLQIKIRRVADKISEILITAKIDRLINLLEVQLYVVVQKGGVFGGLRLVILQDHPVLLNAVLPVVELVLGLQWVFIVLVVGQLSLVIITFIKVKIASIYKFIKDF